MKQYRGNVFKNLKLLDQFKILNYILKQNKRCINGTSK